MTSTVSYSERIDFLRNAIKEADHIIIGAGSGLSTAAGLDYAGEDFRQFFADDIKKYGHTDLYTAGFYHYATAEEYWAHWAKHIWFCRYRTGALPLYKTLRSILSSENRMQNDATNAESEKQKTKLFIVTTNVDGQFELAGFQKENIFATQGDYSRFQPVSGVPKITWSNRRWVEQVLPLIDDCCIPTNMIPFAEDGQPAALNLRVDDHFVEDDHWHRQAKRYTDFVEQASQGKLLLLEFGIGYNTPGIIRLPFEQMAQRIPGTTLVRFNRDNPEAFLNDMPRFVAFTEEIGTIVESL